MQSSSGRGRGNPYRHEMLLTDEQRLSLGTDRWLSVAEIAATLGIKPQAVRNAITRGSLKAFKVPRVKRKRPVACVKAWRVLIWRDRLAGLSDGREEDYEPVE